MSFQFSKSSPGALVSDIFICSIDKREKKTVKQYFAHHFTSINESPSIFNQRDSTVRGKSSYFKKLNC
jgi:hypothetical protein